MTDAPWIFRTYAGHTSARASNELYRKNLAAGQTGLSIAFDLPTQCGYDSDHPLARPEVGKVGVPIASLDDMHALFDGIPIERMNTSMTINGTAMWLLALYVALARERGVARGEAARHDAERHRQGVPRARHVHLPARAVARSDRRDVRVLRRAACRSGTRRTCAATTCRRPARRRCRSSRSRSPTRSACSIACARAAASMPRRSRSASGRVSFFVNAGIRFVEEMCKMRAFGGCGTSSCASATASTDPEAAPVPLRRAGQLARPHRAAAREQRVAHPDRDARRDAVEGRALPRAAAADVERGAVAAAAVGSAVVAAPAADPRVRDRSARVRRSVRRQSGDRDARSASSCAARARSSRAIDAMGGIRGAIETGYCKRELVRSMAARMARIERGEQIVVGVNKWTDGLPSPLVARRRRRRVPRRSGRGRGGAGRARGARARRAIRPARRRRSRELDACGARRRADDGGVDRMRARARDDRRVGGRAARRVGRVSRATGVDGRARLARGDALGRAARARRGAVAAPGGGRACSSASPASTATPTAPR